MNYDNAMRRQVQSVAGMLKTVFQEVEPALHSLLTTPQIYSVKKLVITGCGDGYAAALCAKTAFERLLEIPVEVVKPLELSRYYQTKWVGESPFDPLVIALSNSGSAVRVVEAVQRMRVHNALAIAITGNADSALARAADATLLVRPPQFEPSPGIRGYAAQLLTLYLLAIRLGEVRLRITMEQAGEYRRALLHLPEAFLDDFDSVDELALLVAQRHADATCVEAVGCGPDYGTAWYAHEKMVEAAGLPAMHLDSEEWFHVNYFLKDVKRTLLLLFASAGNPAASRTQELLARAREMGRETVLITDDDTLQGDYTFRLPPAVSFLFPPMAAFLVPALVAGYLAALCGEPFCRAHAGIWREDPGMFSPAESELLLID